MAILIHHKSLKCIALSILLSLICVNSTWAAKTITYPIYPGGAERLGMHINVLKLVLAHSDNEYEIKPFSSEEMTISRAEKMVASGQIDMMWSASDSLRESRLDIVPIPFDYGLLGFRVLMILENHQQTFAEVNRLSDLQQFKPLQVDEWVDTYILLDAGFNVRMGHYQNLPKMLAAGRGDFIPRSVREINDEMEKWKDEANLAVDQNSLLIYRQGDFFYVSKENQQLYNDLLIGLERVHENGELKAFLSAYMKERGIDVEKEVKKRVSFRLNNPYLSDEVKAIDDKYFNVFFAD